MDYFLLPDKIKSQLPLKPGAPSPLVISAASGLDGSSGECHLVFDGEAVRLFSRLLGEDSYRRFDAPLAAEGFSIKLLKDRFDLRLELSSGGVPHSLKFSSFEASNLDFLMASCKQAASATSQPAAPAQKAPQEEPPPAQAQALAIECSPFIALLAALMWAAKHDGEISQGEDEYICRLAKGRREDLEAALALSRSCDPQTLAPALASLDMESRLCIVANLYGACISDGVLRSSEQTFVREFSAAMGVGDAERATIRDVLILKNRVEDLRKGPLA